MTKSFYRQEIKYIVSGNTFAAFLEELSPRVAAGAYPFEKVINVYFDTDSDELIRASIEASVFKEKFRLRTYEYEGSLFPYAFAELKKKYKGVVYKRRVMLSTDAAASLLRGENPAAALGDGQTARELAFFIAKTGCRPKVHLSYDRHSFSGRDEGDLRLTFDSNIVARSDRLDFSLSPAGRPCLPPGAYLMELKADTALPLWLTGFLTKYKVYPRSFSKYGAYYEGGLKDGRGETAGYV
jgi:hypothetical protein